MADNQFFAQFCLSRNPFKAYTKDSSTGTFLREKPHLVTIMCGDEVNLFANK